jgi:type I restriction enzyme S subunit
MDKITEIKIPEVRFKGFTEYWKEKLLAKEVCFFTGLTYSPTNVIKNGGTLVLRSSNVKNSQVVFTDNVFVNSEVVNCENVIVGDIIVVVRNGSRSLIGKHAVIKKDMPNTVIGAFMTGIHSKQSAFINSLLDTNQFEKEIEKNLGATINQITIGAFKRMTFWFPKENEQKQIGLFFQNLDNLITLHQKKYDKLIVLKKAMLVKMFPKDGAFVPEIRFKGFGEEWEQKTLGEIMDVTSVKRIHQSDWTNSGVRFLRARDIVSFSKNEESKDLLYITIEKYDEYSLTSGKVQEGDILVTGVGTIGVPFLINNQNPIYFKDGNIIWFKNENRIDKNFFYYSFINNKIQNFIKNSAGTGTVGTYTIYSGKKTPIILPKYEMEQQKIGQYFQNLDKQISLHQTQLDKLKNIKKACFTKMFVSQD